MDDGGARRHRFARNGAFEHLEPGVGGAVAVVQSHFPMRQLLRHVDVRIGRNDEGRADDHRAATDLKRTDPAFRHPAVIAALSPLEHRGFAAFLKPALIRHRSREGPFRRGADIAGLPRRHRRSSPSALNRPSSMATSTSRLLNADTGSIVIFIAGPSIVSPCSSRVSRYSSRAEDDARSRGRHHQRLRHRRVHGHDHVHPEQCIGMM
jgi:hypothetical protein